MRTVVFLFLSIYLVSCGVDDGNIEGPVNIMGGQTRSNSYEKYGNFTSVIKVMNEMPSADTSGVTMAPLVMANREYIVSTSKGSIVKLGDDISRWSFALDSGINVAANMVADANDNIYAIATDANLYSLDKDGNLRWKTFLDSTNLKLQVYTDLLATSDGIYSATNKGYLAKFDFDGKKVWEKKFSTSVSDNFSADSVGNLIIPITQNKFDGTDSLIYMRPNGDIIWQKGFQNLRILKNAVSGDGRISLIGLFKENEQSYSKVISLDMDGEKLWEIELDLAARFLSIAEDGTLYASGFNAGMGESTSGVFSISPKGELNWKLFLGAALPAPAMISGQTIGVVGLSNKGAAIFYIDREKGELSKTVSLANAPILNMMPSVTPQCKIVFGGVDRLSIIKIEGNPFSNIIPN